jgi:hypothetical protein
MDGSLAPVADRLLDALPQVYREADAEAGGGLRRLLAAFEAVLLGAPGSAHAQGLEQAIAALPALLAPDEVADAAARQGMPGFEPAVRDAMPAWMARHWVGFTPAAHFEPARLRRIVGAIVPMYGRRGTPAYLLALLRLCFDGEIADVALQEHVLGGLRVGRTRVGRTTQLGRTRPFTFRLSVVVAPPVEGRPARSPAALHAALTAVIDFAKPAHTVCELQLIEQPATAADENH